MKRLVLGKERVELAYHLTHALTVSMLPPQIFIELYSDYLNCWTLNNTMASFSRHWFESSCEEPVPDVIAHIEDKEILKEFKQLLKRKTAGIEFEVRGDLLVCTYEYTVTKKTEDGRKKVLSEGELVLGEDRLERPSTLETVLSCCGEGNYDKVFEASILPAVQEAIKTEDSKYEYDVISIEDILLSKKDLRKLMRVYGDNVEGLYMSYNVADNIVSVDCPNSPIVVYMQVVEKIK